MGVGDQRHAPAALPPEKDPVPIVQEIGWALRAVWTGAEKSRPLPGFDPRTGEARSESLYRKSYRGPAYSRNKYIFIFKII